MSKLADSQDLNPGLRKERVGSIPTHGTRPAFAMGLEGQGKRPQGRSRRRAYFFPMNLRNSAIGKARGP